MSFASVSPPYPFARTRMRVTTCLEKARHFVAIGSPRRLSRFSHLCTNDAGSSEFLGYIIRSFCGAAHTPTRMRCTRSHAAYVLQARWTKLWPVSIGRALRVVYRSTFWSCNTRPDTDRRDCAAAPAAATYSEPIGPSIVQANIVHALRNCRQADRPFVSTGKNPLISSG